MNIIVAGCGSVGYSIAKVLREEGHDITLIDQRKDALETACTDLDVLGVVGHAGSYNIQQEAGIENCDMFVAVTNVDELNLLCCVMAKKGRNINTIARVRNPIYKKEEEHIKDAIGLSMIINPEYTASKEILRILRFPSATKIDTFSRGKAEIVQYPIPKNSPLVGLSLIELGKKRLGDYLICAIERKDDVIIPDGTVTIQSGDIIYVLATPKYTSKFFYGIGAGIKPAKNVMLVGGSMICHYLAKQLLEKGVDVSIIEAKHERCVELSTLLPKANVICGDATEQNLLEEEGLLEHEAMVTLTGIDEENIMLSMYAQNIPTIKKVVTKVKRSTFDSIICKLPIGSIINPKLLTSYSIIRYVRSLQNPLGSAVETFSRIIDGKVEVLEFHVGETCGITNIPLINLKTKDHLLISCINRKGKIIIPKGNDVLLPNDHVIVITLARGLKDLNDILVG